MTDNASRRRRADGYEPRFDLDLKYGQQAELLVTDIAEAIRNGMGEVKRDGVWSRTGNVYIEYECRRASGWQKSGIAATDSLYWAIVLGDTEVAIVFPTGLVRQMARDFYQRGTWFRVEEKNGSHPTRGVRIPLTKMFDYLSLRERRGAA